MMTFDCVKLIKTLTGMTRKKDKRTQNGDNGLRKEEEVLRTRDLKEKGKKTRQGSRAGGCDVRRGFLYCLSSLVSKSKQALLMASWRCVPNANTKGKIRTCYREFL